MKCLPHSINCGILDVGGLLSGKECPNGHEDFIDVIGCLSVDVAALSSSRTGPGMGEIWGEVSPHSIRICGILGFGGLLTWKECPNGHGTYTDVGGGVSIVIYNLRLKRISPGVVEIWGEWSSPTVYLRKLVCLGFVEGEGAGLWS